jgi:KDO2-lipid IV(A) lauroyltransferase
MFLWLFKFLPYSFVNGCCNLFLPLAYICVGRHRKVAKESLEIAFKGKKSKEETDAIMKQCFMNLGRGMIEMLYFVENYQEVFEKVHVEGIENLEAALEKGKGVVGVTAHFGNFPLMMMYFSLKNYLASVILRPTRDQKLEDVLHNRREKFKLRGIYATPRKQCVDKSLRALRNNEILFIPLDQNFGSQSGVFVDFFGQKAATATGPVVLAQRTGATILPFFTIRQDDNTHKVIIEKPIELTEEATSEEFLVNNTSKLTGIIESYIRKYPWEWGWMHRRWKSQPKDIKNRSEQTLAQ